jgi:hypothetical protein
MGCWHCSAWLCVGRITLRSWHCFTSLSFAMACLPLRWITVANLPKTPSIGQIHQVVNATHKPTRRGGLCRWQSQRTSDLIDRARTQSKCSCPSSSERIKDNPDSPIIQDGFWRTVTETVRRRSARFPIKTGGSWTVANRTLFRSCPYPTVEAYKLQRSSTASQTCTGLFLGRFSGRFR